MAVFVAFNKHIADELGRRLPLGLEAKTIHSLGRKALIAHLKTSPLWPWSGYPGDDWVDDQKYRKLVQAWFGRFVHPDRPDPNEDQKGMLDLTVDLVEKCMVTLTNVDEPEAIMATALYFDLLILDGYEANICHCVQDVLLWGKEGMPLQGGGMSLDMYHTISITDMIYLPVVLPNVRVWGYKTIYVDEAQDLSACQRKLVLLHRMLPKGEYEAGRIFWVGDVNQSLYRFAGADAHSVQAIKDETGATELPLSICYRCPASHVKIAQQVVPHIEARPNAPEGEFVIVPYAKATKSLEAGDLVICRTVAPVIGLAFDLLAARIPFEVKGRDIAAQLEKVIRAIEKQDKYCFEEFEKFLNDWYRIQVKQLQAKRAPDSAMERVTDQWSAIGMIYKQENDAGLLRDAGGIVDVINKMFEKEEKKGRPVEDSADRRKRLVTLCSVHKSKGLQSDRVFILYPHLMPHPRCTSPEEMIQEWNAWYVAHTRATQLLGYIVSPDHEPELMLPLEEEEVEAVAAVVPEVPFQLPVERARDEFGLFEDEYPDPFAGLTEAEMAEPEPEIVPTPLLALPPRKALGWLPSAFNGVAGHLKVCASDKPTTLLLVNTEDGTTFEVPFDLVVPLCERAVAALRFDPEYRDKLTEVYL